MINNKWDIILNEEYGKDYFNNIRLFLKREYAEKIICPKKENIFNSLKYTDYDDVKVVIIGQDPYHGLNEANGLSFSVYNDIQTPPSLRNIFKELHDDLGITRVNKDLTDWAKQGVLLLNAILTVELDKPLSHKDIGWEKFTDEIICKLNEREKPVIFLLWGSFARSKKKLITNNHHFVIESTHPSPLSSYRGFFGSKPFSKINIILENIGDKPINW